MNDALRGHTTSTNSERGHGRVLEVEEISSPKVGTLIGGPWRVGSRFVARLIVDRGGFEGGFEGVVVVTVQGLSLAFW
jgi:hypothetical protein